MYIKYAGHSCFLLKDGKKSIVTDPFGDIGYKQEKLSADYCICSHQHFDHHAVDYVDAKEIITAKNHKKFRWIDCIPSFHDECGGRKRGENAIFKFKCGNFTICHMGDLGEPLNPKLCEKIGHADILLIPVGGKYTIDFKEAFEYVRTIGPSVVIPMHYRTHRGFADIGGKTEFLSLFPEENVVKKENPFEIDDLPGKTVVFDIADEKF